MIFSRHARAATCPARHRHGITPPQGVSSSSHNATRSTISSCHGPAATCTATGYPDAASPRGPHPRRRLPPPELLLQPQRHPQHDIFTPRSRRHLYRQRHAPGFPASHHRCRPARHVEGHGVAETAEVFVLNRFPVRQRRVDISRAKDGIEAAQEPRHPGPIGVQFGPVARESRQIRPVRLQLVQPAREQRMHPVGSQPAHIGPQPVASVRPDQLHLQVVSRLQARRPRLLHHCNLRCQRLRCRPHYRRDLPIRRRHAVIREERHPQPRKLHLHRIAPRHVRNRGIDAIRPRQQAHRFDHIFHPPRHRPDLPHHFQPASRGRKVARSRQPAGGRLDPRDSTKCRRQPNRTRRIAAQPQRRAARRNQRRLSAAAAARSARHIVRIIGPAEQQVVAFESEQQVRQVGPRNWNRPRPPQPFHHRRIRRRDRRLPPAPRPRRAPAAGLFDRILDAERHAVQRPAQRSRRQFPVGRLRIRQRPLRLYLHGGVQHRVDRGDPFQMCAHQLPARDVARAHQPCLLARGERHDPFLSHTVR